MYHPVVVVIYGGVDISVAFLVAVIPGHITQVR